MDQPLIVQYFTYLGNLLQGDLGVSNQTRVPVLESIGQVFPASIELGIGAILLSVIIGLLLGLLSALKQNTIVDPDNQRSIALLTKLGLRFEDMRRLSEDQPEVMLFGWNKPA